MMAGNDKLTLNVSELAVKLGISRPKAYELARRDDFPSIRVGRRIVVTVAALERWLVDNA